MRTPVEVQIWRLSVLFLAGIAASILFQAYTAFRGVFRPKRLGRHFLDVVFSLVTLAAAAAVVFLVNWGELRLYVAISLVLGFWICNYLVGELVYSIAYRSFTLAKRGGRWTRTKVITPSHRFLTRTGSKAKTWLFPPTPPADEPPGDEAPPPEDEPTPPEDGNQPPDDELPPRGA